MFLSFPFVLTLTIYICKNCIEFTFKRSNENIVKLNDTDKIDIINGNKVVNSKSWSKLSAI